MRSYRSQGWLTALQVPHPHEGPGRPLCAGLPTCSLCFSWYDSLLAMVKTSVFRSTHARRQSCLPPQALLTSLDFLRNASILLMLAPSCEDVSCYNDQLVQREEQRISLR